MTNAGEVKARLTLENDEFKRKVSESKSQMGDLGTEADKTARSLGFIEKSAMLVGGAVVAGIGGSVKLAAEFEQGMARVKGITGATESEFVLLEDTARSLGRSTRFTTQEAAEGMQYLAMAGFDVNQIVGSMQGVLNLASARQLDLGSSADIVSNIMTGFGLSADESGRAVDVLVSTMTSANTDLLNSDTR